MDRLAFQDEFQARSVAAVHSIDFDLENAAVLAAIAVVPLDDLDASLVAKRTYFIFFYCFFLVFVLFI